MNLNSALVAVVMMVGSMAATGCKSTAQSAAPEAAVKENAPVVVAEKASTPAPVAAKSKAASVDEASNVVVRTSVGFNAPRHGELIFVPYAPPVRRYEFVGRAPTSRHFWVNGYHRWNGREYIWVGGHWDLVRDNFIFVQPHYDRFNGRWHHIPGHWVVRR